MMVQRVSKEGVPMSEIVFRISKDEVDGGYTASAVGPNFGIHTQADTLPELEFMIADALRCHTGDESFVAAVRVGLAELDRGDEVPIEQIENELTTWKLK